MAVYYFLKRYDIIYFQNIEPFTSTFCIYDLYIDVYNEFIL